MTGLDQLIVQIEFTTSTWTDVTQWVDWSAGGSLHIGRATQFEAVAPGTFTVTLDNTDGRFSPLAQTLNDGNDHPYWPNVEIRKRIRFSWYVAGAPVSQFLGYIRGWPQSYSGRKPVVVIDAVDRLALISQVPMAPVMQQEITADVPTYYWPLTDPAGSDHAVEFSGGKSLKLNGNLETPDLLAFGETGPGVGNGTGVKMTPTGTFPGAIKGQGLTARISLPLASGFTIEFCMAGSKPSWSFETLLYLTNSAGDFVWFSVVVSTGKLNVDIVPAVGGGASISSVGAIVNTDAPYRQVTLTFNSGVVTLYINGGFQGSSLVTGWNPIFDEIFLGDTGYNSFAGSLGQVALYPVPLSPTRVTAHGNAFKSWAGETVSDRVTRFLGVSGVAPSEMNVDTSDVLVSTFPQDGTVDAVTGCNAMAVTEAGGSALYVNSAGIVRFTNRDSRKAGPPVVTLSAGGDLDGGTYSPAYDDATLANQVTANRLTASGTGTTQIITDEVSVARFNPASSQIDSYAKNDSDVLYAAQERIAGQAYPSFRLNQVAIDLFTAQNPILAATSTLSIGSRLRVEGMDVTAAPRSQVDLLAEGWTDTFSPGVYTRTLDTSPADAPAVGLYDDAVYGRYQADGITVATAAAAGATTFRIQTVAGRPKFTTNPAMYPMPIIINTEIMILTAPPVLYSGLVQTVTVTRAQYGTTTAYQAIGAPVDVWPTVTYGI